eukprot:1153509-Pelagomonas_calceolata.AAC.8
MMPACSSEPLSHSPTADLCSRLRTYAGASLAASPNGAGSTPTSSSSSSSSQGTWVRYSHAAPAPLSLGVPVAANRGASGIDGVLSTAAGFAEGLARPCTLVRVP